jgi:hypothetical protein
LAIRLRRAWPKRADSAPFARSGERAASAFTGYTWSARLELSRLLLADFDGLVQRIVAQPFLLTAVVGCKERKHIPDYLLFTNTGPVVVDVKPHRCAVKPEIAFTFAWTREAIESRGWKYEVWTGAAHYEVENIRFLAGYRRTSLFDQRLLNELRQADLDGATFWAAPLAHDSGLTFLSNTAEGWARAAVFFWACHGASARACAGGTRYCRPGRRSTRRARRRSPRSR